MKHLVSIIAALLLCVPFVQGQKASDVLENGIHVKPKERIFLKLEDQVLKYDNQENIALSDFISLGDSGIFMVARPAVNIYIRPLNPLNYSYDAQNKEVIDPINEAAATALGAIIVTLESTTATKKSTNKVNAVLVDCDAYENIKDKIKSLQKLIADSKKTKIIELFTKLKGMDFADESQTISDLASIQKEIEALETHFKAVQDSIDAVQKMVDAYDCTVPDIFIAQYVLNAVIKDITATKDAQKKRLDNLKTAYNLVKKVQTTASAGGGSENLKWCIKLAEVTVNNGKISLFMVTIKESGYKLSDKEQEIVSIESKDFIKRTLRIRRFQRFVPEVSFGTVYTFFNFYTYGTTSDSTGQQFIASPTENAIRNFSVSSMINFNYYIPNSPIHPLYQIGLSVNSGIPTFLTGFGIRSNINGTRRLAVSAGMAATWIKTLDKLKVGDKVSGTADIDKDLKYEFSWPPKPYIGLQYNF